MSQIIALTIRFPHIKELCIKTMHFIGSQMYLEHCYPILNHDIALMMALIAITGNIIIIILYYLFKYT